MRFQFIAKHRGALRVNDLCGALGVSRGGFYEWLNRVAEPSRPGGSATADASAHELRAEPRHLRQSACVARSARLGLSLQPRARGAPDARAGLQGRRRRLPGDAGRAQLTRLRQTCSIGSSKRAGRTSAGWPTSPTSGPVEGWLLFAAVLDLFSRRIVGWSASHTMTAQLVADALIMAVWRRGRPSSLLHHSDQGSQYSERGVPAAAHRTRNRLQHEPLGRPLE